MRATNTLQALGLVAALGLTGCVTVHESDGGYGSPPLEPAYGGGYYEQDVRYVYDAPIGVYVVSGYRDHYFHDGWYYRHTHGYWERCRGLRGGHWARVDHHYVPQRLYGRYYGGHPGKSWKHDARDEHRDWKREQREERKEDRWERAEDRRDDRDDHRDWKREQRVERKDDRHERVEQRHDSRDQRVDQRHEQRVERKQDRHERVADRRQDHGQRVDQRHEQRAERKLERHEKRDERREDKQDRRSGELAGPAQ